MEDVNAIKQASVRSALASEKSIELAYLFGSEARGKSRAGSDVDIAILLNTDFFAEGRLELRLKIAEKLNKLFGREIDVVILNTAGSLLKFQVVRDGKPLFERKKGAAKKFKLNAIKEYFDYLPMFNFHYERLKSLRR